MKIFKKLFDWFIALVATCAFLIFLGLTLKFMWNVFMFGWWLL